MKQSLRSCALFALSFLLVGSLHAQSLKKRVQSWIPKDPRTSLNPIESSLPKQSPFSLSSLQTPQAVSNAIQRLVNAFKLLSPKTLTNIITTQKEKLQRNQEAFAENPTGANKGAMAANILAITAASLALAGEAAAVAGVGYAVGKKAHEFAKEE